MNLFLTFHWCSVCYMKLYVYCGKHYFVYNLVFICVYIERKRRVEDLGWWDREVVKCFTDAASAINKYQCVS